jgi:hypothetical protein
MANETIRTTDEVIRSAIENTTANTLSAVFSIIESYKTLVLNNKPEALYDFGKRDAIIELTQHLQKFADGLTAKDETND